MRHPHLVELNAAWQAPPPAANYATALDAWANPNTGIGTSRDKMTATGFAVDGQLGFTLLEQLFHNDDVSARICGKLPETALRDGFTMKDPDLMTRFEELCVDEAFEQAWVFGRLYGGAAVLCGMSGGGDPSQPATGTVSSLLVVDRWSLAVDSYYTDTAAPKYGQAQTYLITRPMLIGAGNAYTPAAQPGAIVHESRLITFGGARTSPRKKIANGNWDDSVLQRCYQVVQAYGLTWASVIHLLQDAAQGVYSMKELWNMIASGNTAAVKERMQQLDEQRSSAKMVVIDADQEKFERVPTPFTSIPELIDRMTERLASAAETPLTVLMGSSPAGMNATGKSDLEIWYGNVGAARRKKLTPAICKLAKLINPSAKPEDYAPTFPPLFVPTAEETARTRYSVAQADDVYFQIGAILPDEVRESLKAGRLGAAPETTIDLTKETHKPAPAPGAAPAAPDATGASEVAASGTFVNTHHYSPKYGR